MNTHKHYLYHLWDLCLAAVIAFLGVGASADANAGLRFTRIVRCDWGANVQQILDRNVLSLPIELRLVGTCAGFNITQDDVVITARDDGICPGATVQGGIKAEGVHRLKLRCIAVTGASEHPGVTILGGTASLEDVSIVGNEGIGLSLGQNAYVEVSRGSISGNGTEGVYMKGSRASLKDTQVSGNEGIGILTEQSSLELVGGSITNNDSSGIRLTAGSSLVFDGTSVEGGAPVSNNGSAGVAVLSGSDAGIETARITNNGRLGPGSGLFLRRSSVEIFDSTLLGNTAAATLAQHSMVVIGGTELSQGMRLRNDSGAILRGETSLDFVICDDKESSIDIDDDATVGDIYCPDPDF